MLWTRAAWRRRGLWCEYRVVQWMVRRERERERGREGLREKEISIACFSGAWYWCWAASVIIAFSSSLHLAPLVRNAFDPPQPAVSILREELCGRRGYGVEEGGFEDDFVGECRAQAVDGAAAVPAEVALQTVDAISGGENAKRTAGVLPSLWCR